MNLITTLFVALGLWWTVPSRPVNPFFSLTEPARIHRPAAELIQQVRQALRTGSAGDLSDCFDKRIELMIDTEGVEFPSVNTTQAEQVLKTFFRKHPPREFTYAYQGSAEQFRYSTGTYASYGESYQVYILMRRSAQNDYLIYSLHIRKN